LKFEQEFKEIKLSLKETERVIRLRKDQATSSNLAKVLDYNPMAIHFSGHGLENNVSNIGSELYAFHKNDGNFLLFEDENGEG
jgi:hypothetical protein